MAPRKYTLGQRAEAASTTRQRIVESALELYREQGVAATTLPAIAQRADVARGTVANHFSTPGGVLAAVLEHVVANLDLPDERIFEGIEDRDGRIRAFVDAMVRFQERTTGWWSLFETEMQRPELQAKEADYWAHLGKVQAIALGEELAGDPAVNATVLSFIHPATVGTFFWAYEQAGLTWEDVRPLLGDLAVDAVRWIARRSARGGLK